jgi:catechol 2,3-dioxygenase-like lactoylglutathione lyase family enzyme
MVELIQDHGDGPSIVRERFRTGESGLHHVAFIVDDISTCVSRLSDEGLPMAMTADTAGGTAFHFVDAWASHGHFLELYERTDRVERFYRMVADAASGWDGRDPVRQL